MAIDKSCRHVRLATPGHYLLDGLWFGGNRPKTGIAFVHGLGSNAFAHHDYLAALASRKTAVLFFSNRGHDGIAGVKKTKRGTKRGYAYEQAGMAHEIFTDCVDDIRGAVGLFRQHGVKRIYLVGHSTGCQKIAYYLSHPGTQKHVAGAVLLCPISDYASTMGEDKDKRKKAEIVARKLVRRRRQHELLPANLWRGPIDAQRFLSLYTPESEEEIFTYAQPREIPRTLQKVKTPLLVVFAGDDEYRDRDTKEIAEWFRKNLRSTESEIEIIHGALHSFKGREAAVSRIIGGWMRKKESVR